MANQLKRKSHLQGILVLQYQYHCEEIVYFSRDSTAFIHIIQYTEVTAWSQTDAFNWNRCTEIQYPLLGHIFNFSTTLLFKGFKYYFHSIYPTYRSQTTEVKPMLSLCKMKSMYWNSVSTSGALLQFQYHSCEVTVYFKGILVVPLLWRDSLLFNIWDFSTTFIQYIPKSNIPKSRLNHPLEVKIVRCFHCTANQLKSNRCWTEIDVLNIQYPLLGHIFGAISVPL